MDVYIIMMCNLSSFGFFIIFFSFYLYFTVHTKLTPFSRFVIHGHDLSSALAQLYLTLGTIPTIILPCTSGYMNGLLHHFEIMSTLNQVWSQVLLLAVSLSFSLLLSINRAFAVSMRMNKWKNLILNLYFGQLFGQIVCITAVGVNLRDGGEEARQICLKKTDDYPSEMDRTGVNLIPSQDTTVFIAVAYGLICTTSYLAISSVCVAILIQSIRNQGKSSQSAQFLANQRRITVGVLYYLVLELVALGIPFISLCICIYFNLGTPAIAQYACISVSIYPIFGPYYVLMSNTDYRNRVHSIIRRARKTVRVQIVSTTL